MNYVHTIHPSHFNPWISSGLRPVQFPYNRVDDDGCGCVDASGDNAAPVTAVILGRHDLALGRLSVHLQPIKILRDRVDSQIHWHGGFGERDDHLRMANFNLIATLWNV